MRIVFFGSGEFAVPPLLALLNSRHEVAGVVTQPDRPAGRGKHLHATPVAAVAEEEGVTAQRVENANDAGFIEGLRSLGGQVGVVAAFGQMMREPLRSAFPVGCINIHASLLPKYRGAAPINHAILAGESKTGVTVFRITERLDAGPILLKRETMIDPQETAGDLHERLSRVGCDAIKAAMDLLEADPSLPGEPQDESQVTMAPKLKKSDGYLCFDVPAEQIVRRMRAMSPWPGARCVYRPADGAPVEITITSASAIPASSDEPPGTITALMSVATADGQLEIHGLTPAGKRTMSWPDFVNGRHVRPGDRLVSMEE